MSRRTVPAPDHSSAHYIVQNNATGRVAYWQAEYNQSASNEAGISLADYIHAMYGFLVQRGSRDVLMIGCGGGTLATMLHSRDATVTIADIDPLSFAIARDYFHMPDGIACHVADGAAFLRRRAHRYDAIVLDAFGEDGMPRKFTRPEFFALAASRLKRGGLFLMNVIVADDDDRTPDRLARAMRKSWRSVRILDSAGYENRNAVIAAGAAAALKRPRLLLAPKGRRKKMAEDLATMKFRRVKRE